MQFLSEEESKQWYDNHRSYKYSIRFETFSATFDRGAVRLSNILFNKLSLDTRKLIWFTDWPLYTELEMKMFERFRWSYGEKEALIKKPGHVFAPKENLDALTCFTYSFLFLWDSFLITEDRQHFITVSHDGFGEFESNIEGQFDNVQDDIKNLGLKLLD